MDSFNSAEEYLGGFTPSHPVLCLRPDAAKRAAHWFLASFPGRVLYALKANDSPILVDALYSAGIRHFDVASLPEAEQLSVYKDIALYLMNPVKSRETIRRGYYDFGIRSFALDSEAELVKILEETGHAKDLSLFVRIACSGDGSLINLSKKFGVDLDHGPDLLLQVRRAASQLGMTFHIGSQSMNPAAFAAALSLVDTLIVRSGVLPDIIDVGGGFPSAYPGYEPPPLSQYVGGIESAFERLSVVDTCQLQCEPGRALVAEAGSTIVRVEHRRGNYLYINDGAYGTLSDAAQFGLVCPCRRIGQDLSFDDKMLPFSFYGPTCDSVDYVPGPFYLPWDIGEGDHIEIGQLGAYGQVLHSRFNGFGRYETVILSDEPMASMYGQTEGGGGQTRIPMS